MKAERIALMPDWPARMDAGMAALYLGISDDLLRAGVETGRYPAPFHDGGRVLWSRHQLDNFVDGQFGMLTPAAKKNSWD